MSLGLIRFTVRFSSSSVWVSSWVQLTNADCQSFECSLSVISLPGRLRQNKDGTQSKGTIAVTTATLAAKMRRAMLQAPREMFLTVARGIRVNVGLRMGEHLRRPYSIPWAAESNLTA